MTFRSRLGSHTNRWSRRLGPEVWLVVLATLFLAAHLPFLASGLGDIDSVNFALALRDFDPARHRPHPPGYPIFIALGKLSVALVGNEARALALLGALAGACSVFPLFYFFRSLEPSGPGTETAAPEGATGAAAVRSTDRRAVAATVLTIACPLFWFTAVRPMSDMPGFAVALVAQALLATAFRRQRTGLRGHLGPPDPATVASSGRLIVAGAFVAGIAIGFRSQAAWLTLPLLLVVLLDRAGRGAAGALLGSVMAFAIGTTLWFVPLVVATGGPTAYATALGSQAREDLTEIDLLANNPTPRHLAFDLIHTFVLPWAVRPLAVVVMGLALIGAVALLRRTRSSAAVLAAAVGPYAVWHLVFQETIMTRYALPLLPAVAYAAVRGLDVSRRVMPVAVAGLVVASLALTVPATIVYARYPSPTFEAIADLKAILAAAGRAGGPVAMHHVFARSVEADAALSWVLPAPPKREWLSLVNYWRRGGTAPVWLLADPRRTDLALIDPKSWRTHAQYRWRFPHRRFLTGIRPDILDIVRIDSPPAWFCEEGWHLTPETLGMAERTGKREAVAFVRRRADPVVLMLEGYYLASVVDADAEVTLTIDGRAIDRWTVAPNPGFFFQKRRLPAGTFAGQEGPFARLVVSSRAADGSERPVRVRITQFNLQSETEVFHVFSRGWHEREYNPSTERSWRWSSEQATTVVHHAGRDVVLRIVGESPLKYFDAPPNVAVRVGSQVLARATPASDFNLTVRVPADALDRADGVITLITNQAFVPAERSNSSDRRPLGLRIWAFEIKAAP